ncbi:GNAT family N-acetyltransferase [Actinoplanes sp. NPDC051513]|uniref:GNAT family N-acetyltransferase n=1 Tax=Actinoplanes sp. NPDC051513 TaxID=3363908 RepID=UPI00378A2046
MKLSAASWILYDANCPDVYFTAGYGRADASTQHGRWEALHYEDRLLLPYVVTEIDDGYLDAASPYGYAGIHVAPGTTEHDLARFWRLVQERWRDMGLVAMFFRFSPFEPLVALEGVRTTRSGDTVTVPIDGDADALWDNMEGRSRTAVRKACRLGYTATVRPARATDLHSGSPFRTLYEQTMRRVGSRAEYIFGDVYYAKLLHGLGPSLLIAQVFNEAGSVCASALVLRHRDRVHYHLAGSDSEAARCGVNNLLLWTVMHWGVRTGARLLHLGGGLQADDNLFKFKRSFGGRRTQFWTGAVVVDERAYDELVERRAVKCGRPPSELIGAGYFPAYRTRCELT